eukprot:3384591-Pyramimonas_sp.AAC.1
MCPTRARRGLDADLAWTRRGVDTDSTRIRRVRHGFGTNSTRTGPRRDRQGPPRMQHKQG